MIKAEHYSFVVKSLREFFDSKGFIEVPAQCRTSILAACEDPKTISTFVSGKVNWPLPQTGQMWLEEELLNHPDRQGVYCITTSYRDEPKPIAGRHERIFPMFEFESHGYQADLIKLEEKILEKLGFDSFSYVDYITWANENGVPEIGPLQEQILNEAVDACFLSGFPQKTSPFWNMAINHEDPELPAKKVDVLIGGMETIGSAERSCNPEEMRKQFYSISKGEYSRKLFSLFGRGRVESELNAYLDREFFPRFGGGIGITRLINALIKKGILSE